MTDDKLTKLHASCFCFHLHLSSIFIDILLKAAFSCSNCHDVIVIKYSVNCKCEKKMLLIIAKWNLRHDRNIMNIISFLAWLFVCSFFSLNRKLTTKNDKKNCLAIHSESDICVAFKRHQTYVCLRHR